MIEARAEGELMCNLVYLHGKTTDRLAIVVNYCNLCISFADLLNSGVGIAFPVAFYYCLAKGKT
jgi:hypothetical protein